MNDKTAVSITESLELQVDFFDGTSKVYVTQPVDVWRTEQFFNKGAAEIGGNVGALAYMAYSVALRRGDAYKAKKPGTSKADLFEAWFEKVRDVSVLVEMDEEEKDDDDDGSEQSGAEESDDPKDATTNGATTHDT